MSSHEELNEQLLTAVALDDERDVRNWSLTQDEIRAAVSKMSDDDKAFLRKLQAGGTANEVKWFIGVFHYFDPESEEATR